MTKRSFLHPNYAISSNTYDAMAKQLERDLRRQCPTPTWNVLKTDDLDHHHAMDRFTFIVVCTLTVNDRRWKHHAKVGREALVLDSNGSTYSNMPSSNRPRQVGV